MASALHAMLLINRQFAFIFVASLEFPMGNPIPTATVECLSTCRRLEQPKEHSIQVNSPSIIFQLDILRVNFNNFVMRAVLINNITNY